jgi:hypothetical protein
MLPQMATSVAHNARMKRLFFYESQSMAEGENVYKIEED